MNQFLLLITSIVTIMQGGSVTLQNAQDAIINPVNKQVLGLPLTTEKNTLSTEYLPLQKFVVMDFEGSALHTQKWFESQANGFSGFYIKPKGDSGANKLSIAVGQGRNGSNALLVESLNKSMGLPGFFLIKAKNKRHLVARFTNKDRYMLPVNQKANRFEFWLRFEKGFRKKSVSAQPPSYPNHQNLHIGTYHFDPSKIDGITTKFESDNWHFYHQVFLRHDKAGSDWIHVVINQQPQHQRSIKSSIPNNPTLPAGNYFELLTRLYIDLVPYFSDPQSAYPIKMWVDDIALSYVQESPDLNIKFDSYSQGDIASVSQGVKKSFPITITNNKSKKVCGLFSINTPKWFQPVLTNSKKGRLKKITCFGANSSQSFNFSILLQKKRNVGEVASASITFANIETILSDRTSRNRSLSDENVEKRWFIETGPHDSDISSQFIKIKIQ